MNETANYGHQDRRGRPRKVASRVDQLMIMQRGDKVAPTKGDRHRDHGVTKEDQALETDTILFKSVIYGWGTRVVLFHD
jgi:hypothetical protein